MLGAMAGDIIGSVYEAKPVQRDDFPLFQPASHFTDDSVLTAAIATAILDGRDYAECLVTFGRRHPDAGYGAGFARWLHGDDHRPYGSWGNGAAMRVGPVGFAFDDEDDVLREAAASAAVTHDHPEGIKGAQAVALAVLRMRQGMRVSDLRRELTDRFGYDLDRTLASIRPRYRFDVSCQGSVPEAIIAALEAGDWASAVRGAVSLGGDADTQGCIAGVIAQARHGVPGAVREQVLARLTADLSGALQRFEARFGAGPISRSGS